MFKSKEKYNDKKRLQDIVLLTTRSGCIIDIANGSSSYKTGFLMLRHCFSDARLRHPMGFTDLRICPKFLPSSVFIKLIFTSKHIQHYKMIFFITDFSEIKLIKA